MPSTLKAWVRLCGTTVNASSEIAQETQIQSSEGKAVLTGEWLPYTNQDPSQARKGLTLSFDTF